MAIRVIMVLEYLGEQYKIEKNLASKMFIFLKETLNLEYVVFMLFLNL